MPVTRFLVPIFLFLALLRPFPAAQAQEDIIDENTISVYAKACEPARPGEARSGARVRAADKASFKAVENITALSDARAQLQPHDFNVLVYHLVDNYLEDMAVRTVEQNDERICVEVTGYLSPQNIEEARKQQASKSAAAPENEEKTAEEPETAPALDLESDPESLPEPVSELPPKPQPKIRQEIAYETAAPLSDEDAAAEGKIIVFVERTQFYNGSETGGFYADIRQVLSENPEIKTTTSKTGADYILKTKVLRARVDPINKQTNRLQMVVQLELINTANGESVTEHQNRFILFQSNDDEQKVASSLMQKLLNKGCRQLLPKIKSVRSGGIGSGAIITPSRAQSAGN